MPERVAGLPGLLRRSGDAELRKALRDGLVRMLEARFGGELPRRWMEEPMSLGQRMDEREQEWFRQGREEGRAEGIRRGREEGREKGRKEGWAEGRALLLRLTARRFGADTAGALGRLLEGVDDTDRLAEVGEMIVDCRTGGELLDRVGQEPGRGAGRRPESDPTG